MRGKGRRRAAFAGFVGFVSTTLLAIGCGARTELFDDFAYDASSPDAPLALEGDTPDSPPILFDASVPDASALDVAVPIDASAIDAGTDAFVGTITCVATTPTVLATATFDLDQIAVDDSYLYFHDENGVTRVSKAGGPTTFVAGMKFEQWPDFERFGLTDDAVMFWDWNSGENSTNVSRADKAGGGVTVLDALDGDLDYGVARDANSFFLWTGGSADTDLYVVDETGDSMKLTSTLPVYTFDVAFVNGTTYLAINDAIETFDGENYQTIATVPGSYVGNLRFDATQIYFLASVIGTSHVTFNSVPLTGGTPTALYTTSDSIGDFKIDDGSLYIADRTNGSIVRMGTDGSNPTPIYTNASEEVLGLAFDDQCIYFSVSASTNVIYAQAK